MRAGPGGAGRGISWTADGAVPAPDRGIAMTSFRSLAALVLLTLASQASAGPRRPPSFDAAGLLPLDAVALHEMPALDVARLLEEDAAAEAAGAKKARVGFTRKAGVDLATFATREVLDDGTRVWRARVRSPKALWVVLGLTTFRLQPGASLWAYSADRARVLGPFTFDDQREHGQLWIPPLPGESVVVEIAWPGAPAAASPNVFLGEVMHGYKRFGDLAAAEPDPSTQPLAGSCNIDVNCPLGANWQDEKRGVVNLLDAGGGYCSGSLITNTAADCKNYVLTASHCLNDQSRATGTIFQFNFERPACGSGAAPTDQQLTGSFLRATYSSSDFTLLEMDDPIPEAWNAYYNGWSRSTTAPTESWCIHHPNNDEKKITYNDDPLVPGQNWGPTHWRITEWEQGTTEPGSSGSPLFDQNSRIVGQLHGGTASCTSLTYDEFGKLDVSWNGGGATTSRLRDWLDPGNTGNVVEDGLDAAVCRVPQPKLAHRAHTVDDAQGNGDGVIDPGETFVLLVDTDNTGTLGASAVSGTLSTAKAGVVLDDPSADWPDIPAAEFRGSTPPHFTLRLDAGFTCGDTIPLQLDYAAAESPGAWSSQFTLPTGTASVATVFQDAMENGTNGWTQQTIEGPLAWVQSTASAASPTHSWFVADPGTRQQAVLLMPPLASLPAHAQLRFKHRYNTESNWDGGVLEYSTDGTSWTDAGALITAGGYNGSISSSASSGLAGRAAWMGDSVSWRDVAADLSALAGQTLHLRWRFATDVSVSDEGWYVDDVVIDATTYTCNAPLAVPGEASDPLSAGAPFLIGKDPGGYALSWSPPVGGGVPATYRLYRTALGAPASPECEADLGAGTSAVLASLTGDRGFLVVARNAAGEGSYGEDSAGAPRPAATGGSICP